MSGLPAAVSAVGGQAFRVGVGSAALPSAFGPLEVGVPLSRASAAGPIGLCVEPSDPPMAGERKDFAAEGVPCLGLLAFLDAVAVCHKRKEWCQVAILPHRPVLADRQDSNLHLHLICDLRPTTTEGKRIQGDCGDVERP